MENGPSIWTGRDNVAFGWLFYPVIPARAHRPDPVGRDRARSDGGGWTVSWAPTYPACPIASTRDPGGAPSGAWICSRSGVTAWRVRIAFAFQGAC